MGICSRLCATQYDADRTMKEGRFNRGSREETYQRRFERSAAPDQWDEHERVGERESEGVSE